MITLFKYCDPLWATTSSYYSLIYLGTSTCVLMEGQTQEIQRQQNVYWVQGKVKSVYQPSGPSCQADHGFYSVKQLGIFLLPLVGMLVHHRVILNIKFASTHLYTWKTEAQREYSVLQVVWSENEVSHFGQVWNRAGKITHSGVK